MLPGIADMTRRFHFISGLPRAGSTLLCAVLRQNPRFSSEMSSPVAGLCFSLIEQMSPPNQFAAIFDEPRRQAILRGVFDSYYDRAPALVFDTNRAWTGHMSLLTTLFPACRVICCVREIGWILDSVERMLRRNPTLRSRLFEGQSGATLYSRTEALMGADTGLIGSAWSTLRDAWFGELASHLLIVGYDGFVRDPGAAMRRLYAALGEPWFEHDFANLAYEAPEYDATLGMPGLHRVAPKVATVARDPAIPPDVFSKYAGSTFWRAVPSGPNSPTLIC